MNIVVFGLSISSAWGNGHATLLRGLFRALHSRGHRIQFFEKDVSYYASHRDASEFPFVDLRLYTQWNDATMGSALAAADCTMVTSYCPDGERASKLTLESDVPRKIFYDLDTPATLLALERGERPTYVPESGYKGFDLVFSYTGGASLDALKSTLGAEKVATLYGWVDPALHHPVEASERFSADLSYLGTYSADRQQTLDLLMLEPARRLRNKHFLVGGAMYPDATSWPANVRHLEHVPPTEHCHFYSSSPLTLNVTRGAFARYGFCPSGRLFEAAACGSVVLSDWWPGLDTFFEPGEEILVASTPEESIAALSMPASVIQEMATRARQRALDCHTAASRADRMLMLIEDPTDEATGQSPAACAA